MWDMLNHGDLIDVISATEESLNSGEIDVTMGVGRTTTTISEDGGVLLSTSHTQATPPNTELLMRYSTNRSNEAFLLNNGFVRQSPFKGSGPPPKFYVHDNDLTEVSEAIACEKGARCCLGARTSNREERM